MPHAFDPKDVAKLEDPRRLELSPPETTLDLVCIEPGMRVVDLGCGSGYYTPELARRVGEEGMVYGLDLHPELLDRCAEKCREAALTNIAFIQSEPEHLPVVDHEVDLVVMSNVLHELPEPRLVLDEIRRIGRPGGQLFVLEWKPEDMPIGPPSGERLRPAEARRILEAAEFAVIEELDVNRGQYGVLADW